MNREKVVVSLIDLLSLNSKRVETRKICNKYIIGFNLYVRFDQV